MTEEKRMPIAKGNSYGVSTAIWENENKKGEEYQSVSINVSYKINKDDKEYKKRQTLYPKDIDNLILALKELQKDAKAKGITTGFVPKE